MKRLLLIGSGLFAAIVSMGPFQDALAHGADVVDRVLADAKVMANARLRYENVDQAGFAGNAEAFTLRLRAGLVTGATASTKLGIDFEWIESLAGHYNSTTNGKTQFPVVADPQDVGLNQLYLQNTSLPKTVLTVGRQRVILDDGRFIGTAGWRQNEQTFDAVRVTNTSLRGVIIDLAYINQVNRVFGPSSAASPWHGDTVLAHAALDAGFGTLTGFAYLIEVQEAPVHSSRTYGLRFAGKRQLEAMAVQYALSYATQKQGHGNPIRYSADYYLADISLQYACATLGAAYEVLGGNGVKGFATPFASLHNFQGWTDQFLNTPPDGVADLSVKAGYSWRNVGPFSAVDALAVYHDFQAAHVGAAYGSEIGFMVKAVWKTLSFLVKYADYDAKTFVPDTRKIWFEMTYDF